MTNFFDYLKWRDDLTLAQSPFNEVDAIILARMAYFPFECIDYKLSSPITIKEVTNSLKNYPNIKNKVFFKNDVDLIRILNKSNRFKNMQIVSYENIFDKKVETQFCALTVKLCDDLHYVVFRGTDDSLIGWKESFSMAFTFPIPAQTMAQNYLNKVVSETCGDLIVGGHSKGGNLAVYSGMYCKDKDRIKRIYNFDGPGFNSDVIKSDEYLSIKDKIKTYIPQSSIVGLMLEPADHYYIIESAKALNILQHDMAYWEVEKNHFKYVKSVTNSSKIIDATFKSWYNELTDKQREDYFNAIYSILSTTNVENLKNFGDNFFTNTISITKAIKNLDEPTKKVVQLALSTFRQSAKESITNSIKKK